jgi:hypothetical protein
MAMNHLRNIAHAVGFGDNNKGMDPPLPRGRDANWDLLSNHSAMSEQNNLLGNQEQG